MNLRPWRIHSSRTIYGVVSTGSCLRVLPFLDADTVVLVRQYRYMAGRHAWEVPTGGVLPGQPIQAAAHRELAEESGYRAGRLEPVCVYHTPPRASWTRPPTSSSPPT